MGYILSLVTILCKKCLSVVERQNQNNSEIIDVSILHVFWNESMGIMKIMPIFCLWADGKLKWR